MTGKSSLHYKCCFFCRFCENIKTSLADYDSTQQKVKKKKIEQNKEQQNKTPNLTSKLAESATNTTDNANDTADDEDLILNAMFEAG